MVRDRAVVGVVLVGALFALGATVGGNAIPGDSRAAAGTPPPRLEAWAGGDLASRFRDESERLRGGDCSGARRDLEVRAAQPGEDAPAARLLAGIFAHACGDSAAAIEPVGSSRVDLQACKLEYSIVSPK